MKGCGLVNDRANALRLIDDVKKRQMSALSASVKEGEEGCGMNGGDERRNLGTESNAP